VCGDAQFVFQLMEKTADSMCTMVQSGFDFQRDLIQFLVGTMETIYLWLHRQCPAFYHGVFS
jgi:hypothetical protein